VVTAFNGEPVTRSVELQRLVSRAPAGSDARLTILRGGRMLSVTARLQELKEAGDNAAPAPRPGPDTAPTTLGLRLAPVTPDLTRRYGIKAATGAAVMGVEEGSPAAAAGLRPGDVIERVGQTTVAAPQEVQAAVKGILGKQPGDSKSVALYVNRGGERQFVIVDVGK
jgi:serine protease Do